MACPYSRGPLDSLFRVFVQPVVHHHPPSPLGWYTAPRITGRHLRIHHFQQPILWPRSQRRYFRKPSQYAKPVAAADEPPRDEAIASPYINLVAEDGTFYPGQRLNRTLQSFDRQTHTLQLVMPGNPNLPREDRNHYPTCRIFTHEELAQSRKRKQQSIAENAKKVRKIDVGSKALELSWAIGENDLAHRMKRAKDFLTAGRRLDITLQRKKGTREVTPRECRRLVDAIEGELEQIPGAKQRKDPEGQPGKILTLFWEGQESTTVEKTES